MNEHSASPRLLPEDAYPLPVAHARVEILPAVEAAAYRGVVAPKVEVIAPERLRRVGADEDIPAVAPHARHMPHGDAAVHAVLPAFQRKHWPHSKVFKVKLIRRGEADSARS